MYRLNREDGTCSPIAYADVPDDGTGCFITLVGAVRFGGVIATPIKITHERVYDAAAWLATGAMVPAGFVTTIEEERYPQ